MRRDFRPPPTSGTRVGSKLGRNHPGRLDELSQALPYDEAGPDAAKARSLGLALLDANRICEGFAIPRFESNLPFPPHRRAIIGLVSRQRRFLRAVYTLADAGLTLEAVGPLRSMLEFLIRQCWLAHDPDLNWKLWMADDHAARDVWLKRAREHTPALHDAAVAAFTPEQREEGEEIGAVRTQLAAELGKQPMARRAGA